MKKIQLTLVIFLFFLTTTPVLAEDILDETSYRELVFQKLDTYVDGSITPVIVNMTVDMDYLMSAFVNIYWEDNAVDWDKFGHGNGTPALVNGTTAVKDGNILPNRIKSMHDLFDTAVVINFFNDEKNPIGNHLTTEINFFTYVPPHGLKMKDGHTFGWLVADNIPAFCEDFSIFVLGWKMINLEPDFNRDWLEEMFIFDNVLKYFALVFTLPAIFIFTWEPVGVLLGLGIALLELLILNGIWRKLKGDY